MKLHTYEVYGEGHGFIGHVQATSERAALIYARYFWPGVARFAFTKL